MFVEISAVRIERGLVSRAQVVDTQRAMLDGMLTELRYAETVVSQYTNGIARLQAELGVVAASSVNQYVGLMAEAVSGQRRALTLARSTAGEGLPAQGLSTTQGISGTVPSIGGLSVVKPAEVTAAEQTLEGLLETVHKGKEELLPHSGLEMPGERKAALQDPAKAKDIADLLAENFGASGQEGSQVKTRAVKTIDDVLTEARAEPGNAGKSLSDIVAERRKSVAENPDNLEARLKLAETEKALLREKLIVERTAEVESLKLELARTDLKPNQRVELESRFRTASGLLEQARSGKEVEVATGNKEVDLIMNEFFRSFEVASTNQKIAQGEPLLFSVRPEQVEGIGQYVKRQAYGKDFALAGGKTSTIGPAVMELGRRLFGRTGLFIAKEGQLNEASEGMQTLLESVGNGKGSVYVLKDINGLSDPAVMEAIRKADHVILERSSIGFLHTEIIKGERGAEYVRNALEVWDKLTKNIQVFQDEVQITGDPQTQFISSTGKPAKLTVATRDNGELIWEVLREVEIVREQGFIERDLFLDREIGFEKPAVDPRTGEPVLDAQRKQVMETEYVRGSKFKQQSLNKILLGVAKRLVNAAEKNLGRKLSKEEALTLMKLSYSVMSKAVEMKQGDFGKAEVMMRKFKLSTNDLIDIADQINKFADALGKEPTSDYHRAYVNVDGTYRWLTRPSSKGNANSDQQFSDAHVALAMEYVGSHAFKADGHVNNVEYVTVSGKAMKSSIADFYEALGSGKNTGLGVATGTVGDVYSTLRSGFGIDYRTAPDIMRKFLGEDASHGNLGAWIKQGFMRDPVSLAGNKEAFDWITKELDLLRDGKGEFAASGKLEDGSKSPNLQRNMRVEIPKSGISSTEAARELARRGHHDKTFMIRDARGEFFIKQYNAKGEEVSSRKLSASEASNYFIQKSANGEPVVKDTIYIGDQGGTTGTNIKAPRSLPSVQITSIKDPHLPRYLQEQSYGRNERISGEIPDVFTLITDAPPGRKVTWQEFIAKLESNEAAMNKANLEFAANTAVEHVGASLFKLLIKQGIREGKSGEIKVELARQILSDFQNRGLGGKDLNMILGVKETLESLKQKREAAQKFFKEILDAKEGTKYAEFRKMLSPAELEIVKANAGEVKLEFASKKAIDTQSGKPGSMFDAKTLAEFDEIFGRTIPEYALNKYTSGDKPPETISAVKTEAAATAVGTAAGTETAADKGSKTAAETSSAKPEIIARTDNVVRVGFKGDPSREAAIAGLLLTPTSGLQQAVNDDVEIAGTLIAGEIPFTGNNVDVITALQDQVRLRLAEALTPALGASAAQSFAQTFICKGEGCSFEVEAPSGLQTLVHDTIVHASVEGLEKVKDVVRTDPANNEVISAVLIPALSPAVATDAVIDAAIDSVEKFSPNAKQTAKATLKSMPNPEERLVYLQQLGLEFGEIISMFNADALAEQQLESLTKVSPDVEDQIADAVGSLAGTELPVSAESQPAQALSPTQPPISPVSIGDQVKSSKLLIAESVAVIRDKDGQDKLELRLETEKLRLLGLDDVSVDEFKERLIEQLVQQLVAAEEVASNKPALQQLALREQLEQSLDCFAGSTVCQIGSRAALASGVNIEDMVSAVVAVQKAEAAADAISEQSSTAAQTKPPISKLQRDQLEVIALGTGTIAESALEQLLKETGIQRAARLASVVSEVVPDGSYFISSPYDLIRDLGMSREQAEKKINELQRKQLFFLSIVIH